MQGKHTCAQRQTRDGALCLCVRAVEAIKEGEEVTISYIEDLACSRGEREDALAHHGIPPTPRACDAALEEWLLPEGTPRGIS